MSSKAPIVKLTNWISIIPHLFIMGLIILLWYQIHPEKSFVFGALTYLTISFLLRKFIPKDHRNGIKKINVEEFRAAIIDFEKSYQFFNKNKWIDTYRFITLLSASKMAYREMALVNIGFCYSQIEEGEKSKEYYERTLLEFPDCGLAIAALKMISSVVKKSSN